MKTKPTKPAAKKAPKPAPIIIKKATRGVMSWPAIQDALFALPTSVLKERLRERGLPIPKDKGTMTSRLAYWAIRAGGTVTLELR